MTNVSEWSVSAGSNNSAPPAGAPENMLPGKVNDCMREIMAAVARWYNDSALGTLTTAGGTTAYTLTTNNANASLTDIPVMAVKANATNTGACTLNVDGLGAKSLVKAQGLALAAGDFATGTVYMIAYNQASTRFEIVNSLSNDTFASGTRMGFQSTAVPTGWVKESGASYNNVAMRLTTGAASTGGSTAFTSVFASRTITSANIPNFTLNSTLAAPAHTHGAGSFAVGTGITLGTPNNNCVSTGGSGTSGWTSGGSGGSITQTATLNSGAVSGTSGGASATALTGSVTTGTAGTAMDFAVAYVDWVIGQKS